MIRLMLPMYGAVDIPDGITDLAAYRTWLHSHVLPEKLAVHFLRGDVWIDLCPEEAFSHNLVKGAVLVGIAKAKKDGRDGLVVANGMLLTNDAAGIGTEPDAMFLSRESLEAKRVWFTGKGDSEIVGSPDIVVEVVSDSSEAKDTDWLRTAYYVAGVAEYWLIDARKEPLSFRILTQGKRGFVATRQRNGMTPSRILGRSVQLRKKVGPYKWPSYSLAIR